MNFLLAFAGFAALVVLHELGHFAAAKAVGMRVEKFSLFFGPMLVKWRRGETVYGIGPIPLGGYVKISGMSPHEELPPEVAHRAYLRQAVWKRIVVIAAGPAVNIVLAFLILWIIGWANGIQGSTVGEVERGSPAAGVLMPGDRLVAVDGVRGERLDLVERIQRTRCAGRLTGNCAAARPVALTVERGGTERRFTVVPRYDPAAGRMRVGFVYSADRVAIGPADSARRTVEDLWRFTTATVSTLAQIFKAEKRREVSGVVGGYETVRQSLEFSALQALIFLAVISFSLGIINLFPFLPLDGGHIFWALAEKIRGRAIPFHVLERAGFIGFALVLGLFFIGLSNDIGRLTGDGFQVR